MIIKSMTIANRLLLYIQARIFYRSKPQSYIVTPTRRRICRPLIRRSYKSFAVNCLQNKSTRAVLVKRIGQELKGEVAAICSDRYNSITRQKTKSAVKDFGHTKKCLLDEIQDKAPTLLTLLKHCLSTKKPRKNTDAEIALIVSIMCKHRRPSACQMQRVISLILYAGHASKQVSVTAIIVMSTYMSVF